MSRLILASPKQAPLEALALLFHTLDSDLKPVILELIETTLVYTLPTMSREEIQTRIGLTKQDLIKTRYFQEVLAEGAQEGKQEGEAAIILRQLQRRFGILSAATTMQISQLNLNQLKVLGEALLEFENLRDVEQWLATV